MTRAALTMCVLAAVFAVGCAEEATRPEPAPDPDRVSSLPRGCRPAEVARLLDELFDAVNRGDKDAAAALVIDRRCLRCSGGRRAAGRSG